MNLQIIEKFITISGEAPIPGIPVYLIRFTGCNLKCHYCDVPQVNNTNYSLTEQELIDDILRQLYEYPQLKILFTGGEPLSGNRQQALYSIIEECNNKTDFYIETNGSVPVHFFPAHTHFVCDWKTPSSGQEQSFLKENLKLLRPEYDCLKMVCTKEDFPWITESIRIIKKVNPLLPVFVSPQWGKLPYKDLAEFILINHLPVTMSLQIHKMIWEHEREGIQR